MQGINNTELQFQMALRDQIIYNQREVHRKFWELLVSLGLGEKQILELGAMQGITMDDIKMITPGPSNTTHSLNLKYEKDTRLDHSTSNNQSGTISPGFFPQKQELGVRSSPKESQMLNPAVFREEHRASYYYISQGLSPSISQRQCNNQPGSCFGTVDHRFGNTFAQRSRHISHYDKNRVSNLSLNTKFRQHQLQQVLKSFYMFLDLYELLFSPRFSSIIKFLQDAWMVGNTQHVNMNSYIGINRTWDLCEDGVTRYHGERTTGVFGHFLMDQSVDRVNSRHGFAKAPARLQKSVTSILPSDVTSKFKGEKQFKCK